MLPPLLGVLVTLVNLSRFPAARQHPGHGDVVMAGDEAGNVTMRHPAWGSPHRSRMRRWLPGAR